MGGDARQSLKPQSFPRPKIGLYIPFPRLDQAVFSTQSHYYLRKDVSVQFLTLAKSDQNLTLHQKKVLLYFKQNVSRHTRTQP